MTYAIIQTGGKQLRVEPGRFYDIELLPVEPDETVTLETVLLVQHDGEVTIGQPFVDGATVEGQVLRHLRGRKVLVYKMKPKKKTRKKRGHRQEITRLMINSISLNGSVFVAEAGTVDVSTGVEAATPVNSTVAETAAPIADEVAAEVTAVAATEPVEVVDEAVVETAPQVVTEAVASAEQVDEAVVRTAAEVATDAETAAEPNSEQ